MITIHARDLARNSFSKQHRNPNPQRADHTCPPPLARPPACIRGPIPIGTLS